VVLRGKTAEITGDLARGVIDRAFRDSGTIANSSPNPRRRVWVASCERDLGEDRPLVPEVERVPELVVAE
jgi:hypothetical protein